MCIDDLLRDQDGVVSRTQVLAHGLDDDFIERLLGKRLWARVHRGVYVDHTGSLSWSQRLWAALLFYGDAAACDESTLVLFQLRQPTASDTLHVAVDQSRRLGHLDGVRLHRIIDLERHLHPSRRPPTLRLETAVLRAASSCRDDASSIATLADACQSRRTTPGRLAEALHGLPRLAKRSFLLDVLQDVASGTFSVLEHRYLTRVERPHGLPTAARQRRVRAGRGAAYRDVQYLGGALVVELDGRLGHDRTKDRWADLDRDIDTVMAGSTTLRLSWGQVLEPCRVAVAVARLLAAVGWRGRLHACGPRCPAIGVAAA